ncbi:hypothetical protein XENTR_v10021363 [Xenopus tropicalis]|nr:hypothetical protein XENTR_v10021363 [Xenopus tropicalis]
MPTNPAVLFQNKGNGSVLGRCTGMVEAAPGLMMTMTKTGCAVCQALPHLPLPKKNSFTILLPLRHMESDG